MRLSVDGFDFDFLEAVDAFVLFPKWPVKRTSS